MTTALQIGNRESKITIYQKFCRWDLPGAYKSSTALRGLCV